MLALAAVGDSEEGFERLCQAIEEIDQEQADRKRRNREAEEKNRRTAYIIVLTQFMSMAEAMETESEIPQTGRKCRTDIGRVCISLSAWNSADRTGRTDYWTIYP